MATTKTKTASSVDRNCTHLAGEFFVAAELSKRGYAVGITLGNAKAIDLLAERDGKNVAVQVKAIATKESICWRIAENKIIDGMLFVLVILNTLDEKPTYFLLTAEDARRKLKRYPSGDIIDYSTVTGPEFEDRWEKVSAVLR